jgi:hypothetical protein
MYTGLANDFEHPRPWFNVERDLQWEDLSLLWDRHWEVFRGIQLCASAIVATASNHRFERSQRRESMMGSELWSGYVSILANNV